MDAVTNRSNISSAVKSYLSQIDLKIAGQI